MRRVLLSLAVVAGALAVVPDARAAEPTITSQVVTSFDGTPIHSTLFVPPGAGPANRVPVVLRGPGWSSGGETEYSGTLAEIVDAGYAVMTWDPRGFGKSGGEATVDAPDREARDVSALIDWLARHPAIRLERPGDPVVGMSGQSYGGGIQLATAAIDARVDAIAPEIPWYDLRYSLFPNGVVKMGWGEALYALGVGQGYGHGLDPTSPAGVQTGAVAGEIHQTEIEGLAYDEVSPGLQQWFLERSLAGYGGRLPVRVPTLVMQGTVDTLFNLNEGVAIVRHVRAQGAPVKFIAFCGGHGVCTHEGDDREHLDAAILRWFDRWLRGNRKAGTGPSYEYRTNEAKWRAVDDFPASDTRMLTRTGSGTVVATGAPTGGGAAIMATPSLPGPGTLSIEVATAPAAGLEVVGVPRAVVDVTGAGTGAKLFLKLVDREANEVLSNQELPVRVGPLSSEPQRLVLDLAGVAHTLPAGHHLDLQIATSSTQFSPSRDAAVATLAVRVDVPVRPRPR